MSALPPMINGTVIPNAAVQRAQVLPPLQSDDCARDRRFRRLSTSPAKVAAQARTAMTMNSCDNGIRNGAARIFAKWYVETEYMPNGNTPPQ